MTWSLSELEEHLLIGSTLVEGSTFSEDEARQILAGRTISGHSVHEAAELLNYRAATAWLITELQASPYLSVDLVTGFHARLMNGLSDQAGRLKTHANHTIRSDGTRHDYLAVSKVPDALREWVVAFNERQGPAPAADCAWLYARFQAIHPFDDGNGRIGRILMSYWLHWKHAHWLRFVAADKVAHLRAIEASDGDELSDLERFFAARISPSP